MDNKRKLSLFLTFYIFVGAILFFALLAGVIQKSQAPADTSATGFGAGATRDFFLPMAEMFNSTPCANILHDGYDENDAFPEINASGFVFVAEQKEAKPDHPLLCNYELGNGKSIEFSVTTYNYNSVIDESKLDLFNRVNAPSFATIIDADRIGIIDYFYGTDKIDPTVCRVNFYHPLNDFEVASILYHGFSCTEIPELNREVTSIFGYFTVTAMERVYATGNQSTAGLLETWGIGHLAEELPTYYDIEI
jgi:hypothetical protein